MQVDKNELYKQADELLDELSAIPCNEMFTWVQNLNRLREKARAVVTALDHAENVELFEPMHKLKELLYRRMACYDADDTFLSLRMSHKDVDFFNEVRTELKAYLVKEPLRKEPAVVRPAKEEKRRMTNQERIKKWLDDWRNGVIGEGPQQAEVNVHVKDPDKLVIDIVITRD